jgi:putative ABC transport system permease protein
MKRLLRNWLWRVPVTDEVDEELAFHLEMRTRELVARGLDRDEARRVALSRLGDVSHLRDVCVEEGRKRDRSMRITQWLDELTTDLKGAVRQMRSAPTFTAVAVATLALGIGANGAMFALVDATLLRPLPLPAPDRLVMLYERTPDTAHGNASPVNMIDWHERGHTLEAIGGFVPSVGGMVMAGADGTAETVPRQWVTFGIFDALGIRPVIGRTFTPDDNRQRASVAVLSESFWRARFGGDPSIVGRELRLDGAPYTVVGVVPDTAAMIGRSSIWAMRAFPMVPQVRAAHAVRVVGRLKPGVTIEAARTDLASVADQLATEFPATNKDRGVTIEPLHDAVVGRDLRVTSLLFLGVVGFVLLICCANVANLLLARATVRARELAVRSALGAGRRRILRQLFTESLLLSVLGGALGAAVGGGILRAAPAVLPADLLPASVHLAFDLRVALFCAVAAIGVGILFGLAPALRATELASMSTMAAESRSTTGGRGGRVRNVLVGAEVAVAVVLLFGAGLLLRTLAAVDTVDRGYRADSVLTMMVDPLGSKYPNDAALLQFFDSIEREVTAIPGVQRIGWGSTLPMGESVLGDVPFTVVGAPPARDGRRPEADAQIVSPSYFETLDLPIVEGRAFDTHDTADSRRVCIVNEAFARRYLAGRSPIGARLLLDNDAPDKPREVIGVARQVKGRPDEIDPLIQVYVPLAQSPIDDLYLFVRPVSGDAAVLARPVRAAIARIDKEQLVSVRDLVTLDQVQSGATGRHRLRAVMVGTFAGLALLLAMVGLFGILAYSVQQRTKDIAVRRALGATTGDVLRLVFAGAARVVAAGALVGFVLAAASGRLLATMLFGVRPGDPLTFALVVMVLLATAVLAIVGPALRAARIDPAVTLRA